MPIPYPEWTLGVHHDGSARYVSNPLPALGETLELHLRVPNDAPIQAVFVRTIPDGEQAFIPMQLEGKDPRAAWYTAKITVRNKRFPYRFKLIAPEGAYYYNAYGISRADAPESRDFVLLADFAAPQWLTGAVFYQIFPDRFHNGDPATTPKDGTPMEHPPYGVFTARIHEWDDLPNKGYSEPVVDLWGGDLIGITQKLSYLAELGITGLYLTPIFTSTSNHRYNVGDFYAIDPHLGGEAALIELRQALDRYHMRLVLDITTNHTGSQHVWFKAAQADENDPAAEYYTFYEHPKSYESWWGVATLPKLNYASQALREVMYRAGNSVMRYWLNPPYRIDGWRIDVWNMTARQKGYDAWGEVGREIRQAIKPSYPNAYLMGENFFDASPSLQGDQLDGVQNYQGFTVPMWRWLAGLDTGGWSEPRPAYSDTVPLPAEAAVEQMQHFMSAIPWGIAQMQFNQLGSHDTPRILTIVGGDVRLAKLAAVILLTYPGVPCVYYGDEIGLEGGKDPDNRRTMIWDASRWNNDLLAFYRRLIELRRTSHALNQGGMQFLYAAGDTLAYLRESERERLIVVGSRTARTEPLTLAVWHGGIENGATFTDILSDERFTVHNGHLTLSALHLGVVRVLIHTGA